MSITAIVENDTIKLPVHVPNGTRVEIHALPEAAAEIAVSRSGRGFPIVAGREKFSTKEVAQIETQE